MHSVTVVREFPHGHDLLRVRIGKRAKQHRIHNRENGGGGTDAESQSKNRNGAEAGGLAQYAKGKAEVLEQCFEEGKTTSFAVLLSGLLRASETDERLAASFVRGEAALKILFRGKLDVRGDFCVEVMVELSATKEGK